MSESGTTTILATLAGGLIAIAGSVVLFFLGESSKHKELEDRSKKDLIAELEQNRRYQSTSHFIDLEDSAYRRFRERGFFWQLSNSLQKDLQELYASIHEKNGLVAYYNNVGVAALSAQPQIVKPYAFFLESGMPQAKALHDIMTIIKPQEEKITRLIDEILPQLGNLLKDPRPDM
jgi:hypothetical protein